jgi:hypothetical protein
MIRDLYISGFVILSLLLMSSCESGMDSCLKSQGSVVIQTRHTSQFFYILVDDIFKLTLCNDTSNKLVISGGENLLPYVDHYIKNDTLYLENQLKCNWARDYDKIEINIHADTLKQIFIKEPSDLYTVDTFRMQKLVLFAVNDLSHIDITISCEAFFFKTAYNTTGAFIFKGKTDYAHFWPYYASKIDAGNLIANKVTVLHHSIGDVRVYAREWIEVESNSKGKVYYTGAPGRVTCDKEGVCIKE